MPSPESPGFNPRNAHLPPDPNPKAANYVLRAPLLCRIIAEWSYSMRFLEKLRVLFPKLPPPPAEQAAREEKRRDELVKLFLARR